MAMSEKKRRKQMDLAQKALPGARVVGYAVGRGGTNPVLAGWIVLGAIFAIFLVLFALTGQVVIIGVLPAILVMQGVSPHRVIVVADQGIAVGRPPTFGGRPPKLESTMAHGYVQPVDSSMGRVKVMVGNEGIWLTGAEDEALRRAIFQHPLTQQVPTPYR